MSCPNADDRSYWIAFSVFPGIGPVRFKLLLDYFGSAKHAWKAPERMLANIHLGANLIQKFLQFRSTFDVSSYMEQLAYQHVNTVLLTDEKYPALLKEISDPPFVLYSKSKPHMERIDMDKTIAIVGTRNSTPYGRDITARLTAELVSCGFTIVSGMAYGVDTVAHETAIREGGRTIAVLGCGVDIIAPPSSRGIYQQIINDGYGAVVSEMPLGLRPSKGLFPARNRIISGLSRGVLVTEGADDSGALITARNAAQQGRDVFAIPGPITSLYSKGPTLLLKQGAVLVESAADIIDALGINIKPKKSKDIKYSLTTPEETRIVTLLQEGPCHADAIVRGCGFLPGTVFSTLTQLEMKGIIKDVGGRVYEIQ